jgi:hypothetical protein
MNLKQEAISSEMVETTIKVGDFARLHWSGNTDFADNFYVALSDMERMTFDMTRTEANEFQNEINKARQIVNTASPAYREVMKFKKDTMKQIESIDEAANDPKTVQKRRQLLAEVDRINALQFPKELTAESARKYAEAVHAIKTVAAVVTEKPNAVETPSQKVSVKDKETKEDECTSYFEISIDTEQLTEARQKSDATPSKAVEQPIRISTERQTAEQEIANGHKYIASIKPKFPKYESLVASCMKDWEELEKQNYYSNQELLSASKLLLRAQRALFDKIQESSTGFSAYWTGTPGIMKLHEADWSNETENDQVVAEIKNILIRADRRANDIYFDLLETEMEFFSKAGNGTKWYTPISRHYHKAIKEFRQISKMRDEGDISGYLSKWNAAYAEMEQLRQVFLQLKKAHEEFEQKLTRINSIAEVHAEDMSENFRSLFDDVIQLEQQLSKRQFPMNDSYEILQIIERIEAINARSEDN